MEYRSMVRHEQIPEWMAAKVEVNEFFWNVRHLIHSPIEEHRYLSKTLPISVGHLSEHTPPENVYNVLQSIGLTHTPSIRQVI